MNNKTKYLFMILIEIFICFKYINKKIVPYLIDNSRIICNEKVSMYANESIKEEIINEYNINKLFIITYEKDNISQIDYDTIIVNRLLTNITTKLRDKINLNKIMYIPIGIISKNVLLTNIGPKIPLHIKAIDSIEGNIRNKITSFGINNALLESYIDLKVKVRIVMPFINTEEDIILSYPIAIKIITGTTPNYFSGANNSSFSLPIQ